jgi:hypothetical protein
MMNVRRITQVRDAALTRNHVPSMKRLAAAACILLLAAGCKKSPTQTPVDRIPDTLSFNVNPNNACADPVLAAARKVAETANSVFWHDTRNPAGGFTDDEYQAIANRFEAEIWPVNVSNFGEPSDVNRTGKVYVLYTRAVNELTPPGQTWFVGGFFFGRDLFPKTTTQGIQGCPASNVAEMFYMLAPDPTGEVHGNVRSKQFVRDRTLGTLAHELQHLINASRRLYVNGASDWEETWLDEGLSHIAEELAFYNLSGLAPRQNLTRQVFTSQQRVDAFNEYALQNFGRLREWMEAPRTRSPFGNEDDLATRGAAWQFLRYTADRRAGDDRQMWFDLVNTTTSGFQNLQRIVGPEPLPWFRDWGVAAYADDAVPGIPAGFTIASWNFRDIYQALGGFPLRVDTLVTGAARNVSLRAGSSAYLRFGVAPLTRADVRTSAPGTTLGGACTVLNLNVGQVHQVPAAQLGALCVDGGPTGADFVVIPFHRSAVQTAFVDFTVTATGVVPPLGPPSPDRMGPVLPAFARDHGLVENHDFHMRLRERERAELGPLMRGGRSRPALEVAAQPAPGTVELSIVRTR